MHSWFIYYLCLEIWFDFFFFFWFVVSHHILKEELDKFIISMLGFVWLLFVTCFKTVFLGVYVCACFMYVYTYLRLAMHTSYIRAHALCMHTHTWGIRMHTWGMHTHTSCMRMHTRVQKCKFKVLAILFVLISFNHMFRYCWV